MKPTITQHQVEALQERHGLKMASYLTLSAEALPHDLTERLRSARVQALAQRKKAQPVAAASSFGNGHSNTLAWGSDDDMGWWHRIGVALPLIALVVGLVFISSVQDEKRARELAEVDAALLIDELPPAAFADPGFLQFLKTSR